MHNVITSDVSEYQFGCIIGEEYTVGKRKSIVYFAICNAFNRKTCLKLKFKIIVHNRIIYNIIIIIN